LKDSARGAYTREEPIHEINQANDRRKIEKILSTADAQTSTQEVQRCQQKRQFW
jgi:hypothetical protein